jgi:hypothetical protein
MRFSVYCTERDCRHYRDVANSNGTHVCRAFPRGIPWSILNGKVIHTTILPGQVGGYVLKPGPQDQLPKPI